MFTTLSLSPLPTTQTYPALPAKNHQTVHNFKQTLNVYLAPPFPASPSTKQVQQKSDHNDVTARRPIQARSKKAIPSQSGNPAKTHVSALSSLYPPGDGRRTPRPQPGGVVSPTPPPIVDCVASRTWAWLAWLAWQSHGWHGMEARIAHGCGGPWAEAESIDAYLETTPWLDVCQSLFSY